MAHLQTTPTGRNQSSRSLITSPPIIPRRLKFGSGHKDDAGYGIVSASGFSTWRRGLKKGSTSTTKTHHSTTTASTGTGTGTTGSHSNPFNHGIAKKELGMGLEGTPARKRFKRDSKQSKTSMGTQSTPKASISRAPLDDISSSLSLTISPITSFSNSGTTQSSDESTSSALPMDCSFAVGAETIIGEDVFGLTISIDADGTNIPLSPGRCLSATPPFETRSSWLDEEEEQERDEYDRLVNWAEVDVPVDFGDGTNEIDEDLTLQPIPHEVEMSEDESRVEQTRIWDITVPIRENSILSSATGSGVDNITQSNQIGANHNINGQVDTDPVEISRGLNISKLGLDMGSKEGVNGDVDCGLPGSAKPPGQAPQYIGRYEHIDDLRDLPFVDAEYGNVEGVDLPQSSLRDPNALVRGQDRQSPNPLPGRFDEEGIDGGEEIDHTSKVGNSRWLPDSPIHIPSVSSISTSSNPGFSSEEDPFGFKAIERIMKRERPRCYRATSSITPPPPSRRLPTLTYSPTPDPSTTDSTSVAAEDASPQDVKGVVWKGAWKGRQSQKVSRIQKERIVEAEGESRIDGGRGSRQVEKVFIEPEYHGKAKQARDARIAHYKDLEMNYKLAIEAVYYF